MTSQGFRGPFPADDTGPSGTQLATAVPTDDPIPSDAPPPVVAVVVTRNPGPWFDDTLAALRSQTYAALSVLVVDAGSDEDPTGRVAAVLPKARVRRLDRNPGFGAAANLALEAVRGANFLVLCHDDVAPEPNAVRALVQEAFRSNAGICGPKLLDWADPRRLRQVGASVDKTGVPAPFAEPGELDQEQHDGVRDVFLVPGGFTLVRADLFATLGGYDEGIDFLGDDLDLCWRAHVSGARVVIVPVARVRHREAMGERRPTDDRRRRLARHRLRTMLSSYGPIHLIRVVPQAAIFSLVEAIYALAIGNFGQSRDVLGAWTWNLAHLGAIRRNRKAIRSLRVVKDSEVRELQVRGSTRFSAFVRGQIGGGDDDRLGVRADASRQLVSSLRARSNQAAIAVAGLMAILLLLGTRNLAFGAIPAIGELADFASSPVDLISDWLRGYWSSGVGTDAPAPTGLALLGLGGLAFPGAGGLFRTVLVVGMLPLGLAGAWRLARPLSSLRAGLTAVVVYAAIPLAYNALASGTWGGLIAYAASPWLLLQLARGSGLAPFGRLAAGDDAEAVRRPPTRTVARQVLSLGLLLALVGAFVPFVVLLALGTAVAMAVGSLAAGRLVGLGRLALVAVGGAALAVVLHLPWSLDLLPPNGTWESAVGVGGGDASAYTVGDLLRFQIGPFGAPPLGWAFLVAAALPLVIGRQWRFAWACRAWFVALASFAVLFGAQEGWLGVPLPAPEVVLAPAAAALALSAAMGMAAFEVDLASYGFGWRQALASLSAAAVVVGIFPLVPGIVDGRWKMPTGSITEPVSLALAQSDEDDPRVVWVGDPEVVPAAAYELAGPVSFATTEGVPDADDRWTAGPDRGVEELRSALRLAPARRTNRLGAALAPLGVSHVVVPSRVTPSALDEGLVRQPPDWLTDALAEQLDLVRVETDPAVTVYRNAAYRGRVVALPGDELPGAGTAPVAVAGGEGGLRRTGDTEWRGRLDDEAPLLLAESASGGWRLTVDGESADRERAAGYATGFTGTRAGEAQVSFSTPWLRWVVCGVQVVLWAVALAALGRSSPRRRGETGQRVVPDPSEPSTSPDSSRASTP